MSQNALLRIGTASVAALILTGMLVAPAHSAGLKVLYAFQGGSDGAQPSLSLRDRAGNLYGVTGDGGSTGCGGSGCGTVFRLGAADGTESILYRFGGGADGYYPDGDVIADKDSNLYGTTYYGGSKKCGGNGCGTVYRLAVDGSETVLHVFTGGRDGALPLASLVRVGHNFYGTTSQGGIKGCGPYNCGTVFKVDGNGNETIVHRFAGGADGAWAANSLIADSSGNLYGATTLGGGDGCSGSGCGTVFKLAPDGTETILHAFQAGSDGSGPTSSLLLDKSGNLYGTTAIGGSTGCMGYGCGTVYRIGADGKERVLYAFQGESDGNWPWANLIIDTGGNLYGTTDVGGEGTGVVFKLDASGTETVLHAFRGGNDGAQPNGLISDGKGRFYGATIYGGAGGQGVVFSLKE